MTFPRLRNGPFVLIPLRNIANIKGADTATPLQECSPKGDGWRPFWKGHLMSVPAALTLQGGHFYKYYKLWALFDPKNVCPCLELKRVYFSSVAIFYGDFITVFWNFNLCISNWSLSPNNKFLDFLEKNCWFNTCRPLIANLHALFKASGPKRHPVQIVKLYTLFRTQDPEKHTLFSGTRPYRPTY